MYILVLAALLQMQELAPKFVSPHQSLNECTIAAKKARTEYKDQLADPANKALGLQFVCMKVLGDV